MKRRAPLTAAQLRKSHDAMAKFLISVLEFSDLRMHHGRKRYPAAEQQYQQALKLVRRAGFDYEVKS